MARHLSLTVLCGLSVVWFLVFDAARATNQCSVEGSSSGSYSVSEGSNGIYTPSSTQQYSDGTGIWVICLPFLPWIKSVCRNGTWSEPWPTCGGCMPNSTTNGYYQVAFPKEGDFWNTSTMGYTNGSEIAVRVYCGTGFRPESERLYATCVNEAWSVQWPTCGGCMPKSTTNGYYQVAFPKNGDFRSTSAVGYTNGSEIAVRVECDTGFRPESERFATCVNEAWSVQWPTCRPIPKCMPQSTTVGWYTVTVRGSDQFSTAPDEEGYTEGSSLRVRVTCNVGYRSQQLRRTTCQNGNWSAPWPTCEVLECLPPANPSGSYRLSPIGNNTLRTPSSEGYRHGDALHVSTVCNDGYRIQPNQPTVSTSCQDGSWTVPWPTCEILKCTPPSTPSGLYSISQRGSNEQVNEYIHGMTYAVTIVCNPGYRIVTSQSSVWSSCNNGQWSEQWPTCVELARCSRQNEQTSGITVLTRNVIASSRSGTWEDYRHGSEIEVTCSFGYTPKDRVRIVCNDGQWSGSWPRCEILKCMPPTTPTGHYSISSLTSLYSRSTPLAEGYTHGVAFGVNIECNAGYRSQSYQSQRTLVSCQDGDWSQPWPTCVELARCSQQNEQTSGITVLTRNVIASSRSGTWEDYRHGSEIDVTCSFGYAPKDRVRMVCNDGQWSGSWPRCVILRCMPRMTSTGMYSVATSRYAWYEQAPSAQGYRHDEDRWVSIECNEGYRPQSTQSQGRVQVLCQDGDWSPPWPTCVELARCSRRSGSTVQPQNDIASSLSGTNGEYRHGSVIEVTCPSGFLPEEPVRTECDDGHWSESWPICVEARPCSSRVVRWGSYTVNPVSEDGYPHGTEVRVSVTCDDGYRPHPPQPVNIVCRNGDWSVSWPQCVDVRRCIPVTTENGEYTIDILRGTIGGVWDGNYAHNTRLRVSVTCNPGYLAEPFVRPTCENGNWNQPWPACVRQQEPCTVPESEGDIQMKFFLNGEETRELQQGDSVPGGSFLVARCPDPGKARLLGDSRRQCDFGEWLGEAPRCVNVASHVLFRGLQREVASNGTVVVFPTNKPGSNWGDRLRVFCPYKRWTWPPPVITASGVNTTQNQREIILRSPTWRDSGNFTCTRSGSSHTVEVLFNELYCPEPVINHGRVVKSFEWIPGRYPIIQRITFECDDEYRLPLSRVYTPYHTCVLGRWSDEIPQCEPYMCPEPVVPSNGRIHVVTSSRRLIGARLEFFCNSGYYLVGLSNERACESNAQWSDDFPICEAVPVRPRSPCESVTCEDSWKKCTVLYSGEAACTCINPFDCPYEPDAGVICGTDGRNYTSVCQLKARACLLRLIVEVAADNAVCIYGLPEGEEVDRINDYSNWESGSFSWGDSTVTEGQHTSRTPTVAHQQTPPQGDGGEPTQEVTGAAASVEATRTPQATANGGGSEGNLFWDTTTDLWDNFPTDSHWEVTTES
ncbi:complement factor H-like [Diadema antillarum]|uniref:complement factor H-like n=1 Tax=Diadema antillarum TaxID=105358 RepID=UPI003A86059C